MKILLAGGGSGGHILPTLAVAQKLRDKNPDASFLYIGSKKPGEKELVMEAGFEFVGIHSGKLRRYFSLQNIVDMLRVGAGTGQMLKILTRFKPDVVFANGGYVTPPVIIAAGLLKIPVVAHESDIRVGLSNRIGFKWITKLAVAFPKIDMLEQNPKLRQYEHKLVHTGLPIDTALIKAPAKRPFKNSKPIVLITGGSQGAAYLNQVVTGMLPDILNTVNVIHYTGRMDFQSIVSFYKSLDPRWSDSWLVRDFDVDDFRSFMQGADIVISRAGSAVMELEALGKIAIVVPLPGSAGNHQYYNAKFLAKNGAAMMLEQKDLTPQVLARTLVGLVSDRQLQAKLSLTMKELGAVHLEAADQIADLVLNVARNAK